jgi:competence protein ComEC
LDREREALPLWWVVALGFGVELWLILPGSTQWIATLWLAAGLGLGGRAIPGRLGKVLCGGGIAILLGLSLVWWRSEQVATSRLDRPSIATLVGEVERIEAIPAREIVRLTLRTRDPKLPPRIRVNADVKNVPPSLGVGSTVRFKARLTGPMAMPLPGAHDYARDAWFAGIGGIGKVLGPVEVMTASETSGLDRWRASLDRHIRAQLGESEGGIATALATGDQNAFPQADADAMRGSGLAHLLSVSGSTSRRRSVRPFSSAFACFPCPSDWRCASILSSWPPGWVRWQELPIPS